MKHPLFSEEVVALSYYNKTIVHNPMISLVVDIIRKRLPNGVVEHKTILDLGCGPGTSLKEISRLNFKKYIGVDSSKSMLDIFHLTQQKYFEERKVETHLVDLENETITIPSNIVDFIISTATFPYIKSLDNLLLESFRVLKQDGMLFFQENVHTKNILPLVYRMPNDSYEGYSKQKDMITKSIQDLGFSLDFCISDESKEISPALFCCQKR